MRFTPHPVIALKKTWRKAAVARVAGGCCQDHAQGPPTGTGPQTFASDITITGAFYTVQHERHIHFARSSRFSKNFGNGPHVRATCFRRIMAPDAARCHNPAHASVLAGSSGRAAARAAMPRPQALLQKGSAPGKGPYASGFPPPACHHRRVSAPGGAHPRRPDAARSLPLRPDAGGAKVSSPTGSARSATTNAQAPLRKPLLGTAQQLGVARGLCQN